MVQPAAAIDDPRERRIRWCYGGAKQGEVGAVPGVIEVCVVNFRIDLSL